jgi:serine/threonine-protein kinase
MGEVYRAVHVKTERVVAVKFVHRRYAGDPAQLARFDTEVKALARSEHPNVVAIHEVGESGGRPYFTMEYLGGGTLAELARRGPVDFKEAARLVAAAAEGIAAAHAVGVLHRDLKPGNVLLADDGTPKVGDFGLAKLADAATRMTTSGDVIGTPAYMAPEQAAGQGTRVDERADVYGLGAVLYELLTGHQPFKGKDRSETLRLVQARPPEPPGRVRPDVPAGLAAVCLKCLEKDPALRYHSAQALADDLNQWLAGDETVGRPAGRLRRAWRGVVRHRLKVAAGLLLLAVAAAFWFTRTPDPREEIERKLARGEEVVLVAEKGPPRWSEWVEGPVVLAESGQNDGTWGFQTATTSILTLVRDPMTDSYRFSAELRHRRLSADDGGVGVFVGLGDVPARPDLRVTRYLGYEFSDYWRDAELVMPDQLKPRHGLDGRDHLIVRDGALTRPTWLSERSFPFTPTHLPPNGWRTIVVDVTPVGVTVYWGPAGAGNPPAHRVPAGPQ